MLRDVCKNIKTLNSLLIRWFHMFLPLARNKNIVVQDLGREILIYDLITNNSFCLNETSAAVYQACNGQTSFDELRRKHKFTNDIIFLALSQLKDKDLIEGGKSDYFPGLSRREAIRKVGLVTLIALPAIASVVAPAAAMAASGANLFAACVTSADCTGRAANCAEGQFPGSPKRCCIGSGTNTFNSGQVNNNCNAVAPSNFCNAANYICSDPTVRCCSGSGTVNCTTTGNNISCVCTCD